jgi:hypothetical protein
MPIRGNDHRTAPPDRKELSERGRADFTALQPYLARGVVGMHWGLHRPKPVNSQVRGHFHWGAIHGDLEIDDA